MHALLTLAKWVLLVSGAGHGSPFLPALTRFPYFLCSFLHQDALVASLGLAAFDLPPPLRLAVSALKDTAARSLHRLAEEERETTIRIILPKVTPFQCAIPWKRASLL